MLYPMPILIPIRKYFFDKANTFDEATSAFDNQTEKIKRVIRRRVCHFADRTAAKMMITKIYGKKFSKKKTYKIIAKCSKND